MLGRQAAEKARWIPFARFRAVDFCSTFCWTNSASRNP
jgi:hypothetical protein